MPDRPLLHVRSLAEDECRELLGRNQIGRIAYSFQDRVDVRPIFYVFDGEWIFGRTPPGEKLSTIQHNRWVAFEVDEVADIWNWSSVVVRGTFVELGDDRATADPAVHRRAREALRRAIPEAFTDRDPAAGHTILFGIAPLEMTGRCAVLATGRELAD